NDEEDWIKLVNIFSDNRINELIQFYRQQIGQEKYQEFLLKLIAVDVKNFRYAREEDKNIVLEIVKKSGFALQYLDDSLKKNKEIVFEAVKKHGYSLEHAHASLKKDKEIVFVAVNQKGYALCYAD